MKFWILVLCTWLVSATPGLLFRACLLALSHCGRHESGTACTLLLSAGPIEGCSAVLAVRRYYNYRSLVCTTWCSEQEWQVYKQKLRCLFVFLGRHIARRADDLQLALSPRRAPPQQSCASRGWYSPVRWLGLRRAPVSRTYNTYTNTRAHFLLLAVLWCRYCIAGSGAAINTTAAYSLVLSLITCCCLTLNRSFYRTTSSLVTKNETKKMPQKTKKTKTFGKVLFPIN